MINELFTLIYDDSICIGENHDNSVQIYNPKTKEFIGSIEWDTNEYDTVYKYMYEYLQKNIESDCVSQKAIIGLRDIIHYTLIHTLNMIFGKVKNSTDIHRCICI